MKKFKSNIALLSYKTFIRKFQNSVYDQYKPIYDPYSRFYDYLPKSILITLINSCKSINDRYRQSTRMVTRRRNSLYTSKEKDQAFLVQNLIGLIFAVPSRIYTNDKNLSLWFGKDRKIIIFSFTKKAIIVRRVGSLENHIKILTKGLSMLEVAFKVNRVYEKLSSIQYDDNAMLFINDYLDDKKRRLEKLRSNKKKMTFEERELMRGRAIYQRAKRMGVKLEGSYFEMSMLDIPKSKSSKKVSMVCKASFDKQVSYAMEYAQDTDGDIEEVVSRYWEAFDH